MKSPRIATWCTGLLLLCCAVTAHAQTTDAANVFSTAANMPDGETIFHSICQGCHMPDAKGAIGAGTYPALTGNPRLVSPQYMAAVILNGRHDMPSFGKLGGPAHFNDTQLSDEQIAEVINYIRTHFGNHYTDSITAAQVAAMHQ
jgi:mono/diheme cytochrome c family protein